MKCSMETWDSEVNYQTQTLYYCGKSSEPSTDKVFYSPYLTESLEDVSPRTIEAFDKSLDYEWDYLARPNSSCYVHKRNLVSFCETLPTENVLYGVLSDGEKPFLWGGCQYIISRDVVERLVINKSKWKRHLMDDQSISKLADELEIPTLSKGWCASINLQPNGYHLCLVYGHGRNFTFKTFEEVAEHAKGHFFFRVKQDLQRHEDVRIMRELLKYLRWNT